MTQAPGAPREDWEERKDRATRRAIERLEEELAAEYERVLDKLQSTHAQKLKDLEAHVVTWKGFAAFIIPLVSAIMGLVAAYVSPIKDSVAAGVQRMDASAKASEERLATHDKEIKRLRIDSNAVLRVTVDGKPRKQVQKEWESATGVPRIDANP